jgi:hypothetical protein
MMKYLAIFLLVIFAPFATSTENYVHLKLPRGVSIQVPAGWRALSTEHQDLIKLSVESAMELTGNDGTLDEELNLIAANASATSTYAAVRVDSIIPRSIAPKDLSRATPAFLSDLEGEMQSEIRKLLPLQGNELIGSLSLTRELYSGYPATVTKYRRTGPKGPVSVQIIQVMTDHQEIRINLSYRDSERAIWMPVIEKMRRSIVITKWPH